MMQWANHSLSKENDGVAGFSGGTYGGYIAYSERLETYLVPLVLGIIFLLGLIGNGCLICIFCREPSVRSSIPNTFILNLALGDLLVLFCSVPFTATIYTWESWPYGELICKASEFAKVLLIFFIKSLPMYIDWKNDLLLHNLSFDFLFARFIFRVGLYAYDFPDIFGYCCRIMVRGRDILGLMGGA